MNGSATSHHALSEPHPRSEGQIVTGSQKRRLSLVVARPDLLAMLIVYFSSRQSLLLYNTETCHVARPVPFVVPRRTRAEGAGVFSIVSDANDYTNDTPGEMWVGRRVREARAHGDCRDIHIF